MTPDPMQSAGELHVLDTTQMATDQGATIPAALQLGVDQRTLFPRTEALLFGCVFIKRVTNPHDRFNI